MSLSVLNNELAIWTIVVAAVSNAACAILGCYLVLRRLSLLGDAISHAILPGIVAAFLISGHLGIGPLFLGAMIVGLATAVLTQTLHRFAQVPEDASMGVVFTSLFALGVILITRYAANVDLDPGCVIYGLIEFVPLDTVPVLGWEVPRSLISLSIALAVTLAFVFLCWKELKISAFDPTLATAMGISAVLVHYLLMAVVAAVVVASFEAVGSILVVAMLIVPASTAHLMTERLSTMMLVSVAVGVLSAVLGYLAATYFNTSMAGMMAVAAGCQFGVALLAAPRHGLISRAVRKLALSLRIVAEDIVATLYRVEEPSGAAAAHEGNVWPAIEKSHGRLAVNLALGRLWFQGQIDSPWSDSPALTERGRAAAESIVRAHRLWEAYVVENFDLPLDHLHASAERVEHYIGPDLRERLAAELAEPGRDPHGREIPGSGK